MKALVVRVYETGQSVAYVHDSKPARRLTLGKNYCPPLGTESVLQHWLVVVAEDSKTDATSWTTNSDG